MITLEIRNETGATLARETDHDNLYLHYEGIYTEGFQFILNCDTAPAYVVLQLDDAIGESLVYLTGEMIFDLPFGEKKVCYSPKSFSGTNHLLTARYARPAEIAAYRNLAQNKYDSHTNTSCFPHASANVETRGESVFAAKNAINGNTANHSHGNWPYESWGINQNPDAAITIEFGRPVTVDTVILTTRADFPHDAWWTQATISFSNGSLLECPLTKTDQPQTCTFSPRTVTSLTLEKLIKAEDPSPFPALSQIEVYGQEA